MNARRIALPVAFALAVLAGCTPGIKHVKITAPSYKADAGASLKEIGQVTTIREAGGKLYVGAQSGLAQVGPDGQVAWTLKLPTAMVRSIDVDGQNVAFTSYDIAGLDQAGGVKDFFMHGLADVPKYANAQVGLATLDGKLAWTSASSEVTALSPPALGPKSIGVTRGWTFAVYSRADGKELAVTKLIGNNMLGLGDGMVAQATRNRPVVFRNAFFAGFFNYLTEVDFDGKQIYNDWGFGLFSPFEDITAGPVVFKDYLIFGNSRSSNEPVKQAVFCAEVDKKDGDISKEWKEWHDDVSSGIGALATNAKYVYVLSNFHLSAFDKDGDIAWERVNANGLYPGSQRGVRYVRGTNFATTKTTGQLLVATDKKVFLSSAYDQGDAITVLDAITGDYVESINVNEPIVEMAAVGDSLAVATFDSVRMLPLQ